MVTHLDTGVNVRSTCVRRLRAEVGKSDVLPGLGKKKCKNELG